ncbi:hypothetical protein HYV83_05560 [Candidatus Woesearchaeota archaeon]|nr:hypothetical protein [Candidatus Woesearchaeota archaeon]
MVTYEDQMELFRIISQNIGKDVECWAFGGNAMMFYGYKDETKDVDLLFEKEGDRAEFIRVLEDLGFSETSPRNIYVPEKLRDKHKPLMYSRFLSRFDLFVKKIFRTVISPRIKEERYAVHDFKGKHNLRVNVLRKEFIVLLKAVTERDKDFEDILTIVKKEKNLDWQLLIDEAIWQHQHGDSFVLIDVEKMIKELKQYVFIEQKYLKQLYAAASGKRRKRG